MFSVVETLTGVFELTDIAVVIMLKVILAKERRISHVEVFGSVTLIYFDYISSNK